MGMMLASCNPMSPHAPHAGPSQGSLPDYDSVTENASFRNSMWRCRVHASNCCNIASWERGDTIRGMQVMALDNYDYEPFDAEAAG